MQPPINPGQQPQQIQQALLAQQQVQYQQQRKRHASQKECGPSSSGVSPRTSAETLVTHHQEGFYLEQARPPSPSTWVLNNDHLTIGRASSSVAIHQASAA